MKTDRFDEEFRRKLRGLPDESSPDEVTRIHGYVTRHLPPVPGIGWGGLAGYAIGGLVLLGSLLYNVTQYQQTTTLQTTVDSLKTAPPALAQQPAPIVPPGVRTDTVYITRYQNQPDANPTGLEQPTVLNEEERVQALPGATRNRLDNPISTNPNQPVRQIEGDALISSEPGNKNDRRLPQSFPKSVSEANLKLARKEARKTIELATDSTRATLAESVVKKAEPINSESVRPETSAEPNAARPLRNTVLANNTAPNRGDLVRAKTRRQTKANDPINGASARGQMSKIPGVNQTLTENTAQNPTGSRLTEPAQPRTELEKELTERAKVAVSLLKNRVLLSNNLSVTILRTPVYQPVASSKSSPLRKSFRVHLPTVSLAKAQYFGGAGISLGNEQFGGSLLGEVRLTRHWSLQTGLRLLSQTGFQYHSSEDFEEHEGRDFRALFAPNVAPGHEIQNIDQTSTLLQLPLTIAYHYPLGRAWALRLGIGTNLDLLAHSRITFDFERSGREFEHGLYESSFPVSLFNNTTVSVGLERQWKRLLFRASPYISPQIKRVGYRPEDVYWGGQVQVLWQFK